MSKLRKVLVANRGEIAVRVIRAARDAGLGSVAVYAEQDREAMFVHLADEAYALEGTTAAESYLNVAKILRLADRSGADSIHPGYGFLAENADFAQAVIDANLTWIGPSPQAIRDLGDKVTARHIALRAGAPLVPGTPGPVTSAAEAATFAEHHGLPIAIKAAFGGGGRGMKVARALSEIPELYDSAVREATAAFGRGDCYVERYLDKPRHVEAQVLADTHGNVIVVGTRDCSLQRRFQKLVEEAPAPFLTDTQRKTIHAAAKAICREAGYHGAGTVEFLVTYDGLISFLEVNTRLQVEHPVSEETTGVDLVREQFRIAEGHPLDLTDDPQPHGHSIEFRINGEDPARGFLPAPGTITTITYPTGPGVRIDTGVHNGSTISGQFDSLLAKLIITGTDRQQALQRARRALNELHIHGIPTVLPFHRAIVNDPAFTATTDTTFTVHTRWIETEWNNTTTPFETDPPTDDESPFLAHVLIGGRPMAVELPGGPPERTRSSARSSGPSGTGHVTAPMPGTVVKVAVADGDQVSAGDVLVVLEAMKMENPVLAPRDGVVTGLTAQPGQSVQLGHRLLVIDAG